MRTLQFRETIFSFIFFAQGNMKNLLSKVEGDATAVEEVLIIQKKKLQNFLVPECSLGLKLS